MTKKSLLYGASAVIAAIALVAAGIYAANAQQGPAPQPSPPPWAGAKPGATNPPSAPVAPVAPAQAAPATASPPPFTLASVTQPGETLAPGDLMQISRAFDAWTMTCDFRLSTNRRVCSVQQSITSNSGGLIWRVSLDASLNPLLILVIPDAADLDQGVKLSLGSVERVLRRDQWRCLSKMCVAALPYDATMNAAVASQQVIPISYKIAQTPVNLEAPMKGFTAALDAIAKDPLGRLIASKAATEKPDNAAKPAKPALRK